MWIKLNDTFPGASKGLTKNVDEITAKDLIAKGQAEEATDPGKAHKQDGGAEKRQTKEDKGATDKQSK